jgi:2-C-methyl-D-erythritol 4-phosphate cytidylyltransferase
MAGRPVITYVLEILEQSACVDGVCVVCVPAYEQAVREWCNHYGYHKVKWIVQGGDTCQASTYCGIRALEGVAAPTDVVAVCLSTGVFLDEEILADSFATAAKYGNAMAAMPCIYKLAQTFDGVTCDGIHYKETRRTLNLPWTVGYGIAKELYDRAWEEGVQMDETAYLPTLLLHYGCRLYLSKDTSLNKLHLTTPEDTEILTAILERRNRT